MTLFFSLLMLLHLLHSLPVATSNTIHLRKEQDDNTTAKDNGSRSLIVNGVEALPNEFPWFTSLLRSSSEDHLGCGGTLISPNRILTAAHCVLANSWVPELGPPAYVRIGHTTHSNGQVVPVDCVSIHPHYIARYNDLAIVKLATNVTDVVDFPILNNDTSYPSNLGQPLTTLGFGAPSGWMGILGTLLMLGRVPKTRRLQKLTTHFVDADTCRQQYYQCADSNYYACARANTGDAGVCYGDSGGALIDDNRVLIGVTSFKGGRGIFGCGGQGFPDIYVNVAQYYEWIQTESQSETCPNFTEGSFEKPCEYS